VVGHRPSSRCPQVVWCHWGEIEPFSTTLAQVRLAECDQPGENPLKYSAVAGDGTQATGRTDSELSHWAIMTDYSWIQLKIKELNRKWASCLKWCPWVVWPNLVKLSDHCHSYYSICTYHSSESINLTHLPASKVRGSNRRPSNTRTMVVDFISLV